MRPRIGIDLGGTKIEGIALDGSGVEIARERVPTPKDDYDATLRAVAGLVARLESRSGGTASVGIGTPGALSRATGLLKNSNSTCLNGRPLDRDLEALLGRPLRFANDANCFALSEAVDGAGAGSGVVFGAILGTGVGGGIVVDRKPLTGRNAIAGEWGHAPLPWPEDDERPGPPCYCGRRGCIETFLSGPGLAADHERVCGVRISAEAIAAAAEASDPVAVATLRRYASRLARGLAMMINVLDPDVIVLGGGVSKTRRLYDEVPALWGRWVFSDRVDTPLRPPVHGDSGGVRGAAWLGG